LIIIVITNTFGTPAGAVYIHVYKM